MSEQTLLMVFIGLVALALVAIAGAIVFVAWQLIRLIKEILSITQDVHTLGAQASSDMRAFREKVARSDWSLTSVLVFLGSLVVGKFQKRRRTNSTKAEKDVKD